jgi:hypothetical protein
VDTATERAPESCWACVTRCSSRRGTARAQVLAKPLTWRTGSWESFGCAASRPASRPAWCPCHPSPAPAAREAPDGGGTSERVKQRPTRARHVDAAASARGLAHLPAHPPRARGDDGHLLRGAKITLHAIRRAPVRASRGWDGIPTLIHARRPEYFCEPRHAVWLPWHAHVARRSRGCGAGNQPARAQACIYWRSSSAPT